MVWVLLGRKTWRQIFSWQGLNHTTLRMARTPIVIAILSDKGKGWTAKEAVKIFGQTNIPYYLLLFQAWITWSFDSFLLLYFTFCMQIMKSFMIFWLLLILFKLTFFKKFLSAIQSVSNNLDPDQAQYFVGPYLGPNCLQGLSADDTGK